MPYPITIQSIPTPKKCAVCIHSPILRSIYCPRCQNIVTSTCHEKLPRRLAAIKAYSQPLDAFLDALFGVILNLDDPYNPFYRNFVDSAARIEPHTLKCVRSTPDLSCGPNRGCGWRLANFSQSIRG